MSLADLVKTEKRLTPRRVLVYGSSGQGKSTFASQFKNPIFISTEDGLDSIETNKLPLAKSFDQAMEYLTMLYKEDHDYKTVVIDSCDWLEKLIWIDVAKEHGVKSIEDIGYARGFIFALSYWARITNALDMLKNEKSMNSVLIAHSKIEKFQCPETADFDRYSPDLHKKAAATLVEWCDDVLFFNSKAYVSSKDGDKSAKGVGSGERYIFTEARPSYQAKNRLDNLPCEMLWDINNNPYLGFLRELMKEGGK